MSVSSLNGSALSSISKLIFLTILLNSADTVLTSLALDLGISELNPLVAVVLNVGMIYFLFIKLLVVNLLILFLGLVGSQYRVGRVGMVLIAAVYSILIFYHLISLCLI